MGNYWILVLIRSSERVAASPGTDRTSSRILDRYRTNGEDIRCVALSKGTIDALMEVGWVRIRGRKRTVGRPVTYGTTESFLVHFGLENVGDLPGVDELKAAGFLDAMSATGLDIPAPSEEPAPDDLTRTDWGRSAPPWYPREADEG